MALFSSWKVLWEWSCKGNVVSMPKYLCFEKTLNLKCLPGQTSLSVLIETWLNNSTVQNIFFTFLLTNQNDLWHDAHVSLGSQFLTRLHQLHRRRGLMHSLAWFAGHESCRCTWHQGGRSRNSIRGVYSAQVSCEVTGYISTIWAEGTLIRLFACVSDHMAC